MAGEEDVEEEETTAVVEDEEDLRSGVDEEGQGSG